VVAPLWFCKRWRGRLCLANTLADGGADRAANPWQSLVEEMGQTNSQVKSRQRVTEYGEVFTSAEIVNAMLDLVKHETQRIDSRFLEPACGTGNFLEEILRRKLEVVVKRYRRSQLEFERNLVHAVSSLYGIDILRDNVEACRKRLFEVADECYSSLFKRKAKAACRRAVQYILGKNIIWGDALELRTVSHPPQLIIFAEWSFPFHNNLIKRRDFVFAELLNAEPDDLLRAGGRSAYLSDTGKPVFIPTETRSYPLVHFLKVAEAYDN